MPRKNRFNKRKYPNRKRNWLGRDYSNPAYAQFRKEVKDRDGRKCQWPGCSTKKKLEVHHIFPKSKLYEYGYRKSQVNALANFCFLIKESNLYISNQFPQDYFPKMEANHPGTLESQWVPMDPTLWQMENFPDFLEARKELLTEELNTRLELLLHGDFIG